MFFSRKNINALSDKELVSKYQKTRNVKYFGNIFNRYSHLVFGVCLKYLKNTEDAEDATMQIFEKAMKDMITNNITYPKSWLYSVSKNHCLMNIRSKKPNEIKNEGLDNYNEEKDGINEKMAKEIQLTELEVGLKILKPDQKLAIELFYLKDSSYNEISKITGWPINKVKSEIQNGKRNLKLIISKNSSNE